MYTLSVILPLVTFLLTDTASCYKQRSWSCLGPEEVVRKILGQGELDDKSNQYNNTTEVLLHITNDFKEKWESTITENCKDLVKWAEAKPLLDDWVELAQGSVREFLRKWGEFELDNSADLKQSAISMTNGSSEKWVELVKALNNKLQIEVGKMVENNTLNVKNWADDIINGKGEKWLNALKSFAVQFTEQWVKIFMGQNQKTLLWLKENNTNATSWAEILIGIKEPTVLANNLSYPENNSITLDTFLESKRKLLTSVLNFCSNNSGNHDVVEGLIKMMKASFSGDFNDSMKSNFEQVMKLITTISCIDFSKTDIQEKMSKIVAQLQEDPTKRDQTRNEEIVEEFEILKKIAYICSVFVKQVNESHYEKNSTDLKQRVTNITRQIADVLLTMNTTSLKEANNFTQRSTEKDKDISKVDSEDFTEAVKHGFNKVKQWFKGVFSRTPRHNMAIYSNASVEDMAKENQSQWNTYILEHSNQMRTWLQNLSLTEPNNTHVEGMIQTLSKSANENVPAKWKEVVQEYSDQLREWFKRVKLNKQDAWVLKVQGEALRNGDKFNKLVKQDSEKLREWFQDVMSRRWLVALRDSAVSRSTAFPQSLRDNSSKLREWLRTSVAQRELNDKSKKFKQFCKSSAKKLKAYFKSNNSTDQITS